MQPVGPYRFIEAISVCQVGSVWSAIDGQGNSFTAAVLDAAVATDQRWRDAFAGTAHALAQPGAGGSRFAHADLTAPAPWVAYAAADSAGAEQLFLALGMECRPLGSVTADDETVTMKSPPAVAESVASSQSNAPDELSTGPDEELASPTTRLTPNGPWQTVPPQAGASASPDSVSAPPHQVSVPPHQTSAPPHQVSVPPHQTSAPPHQVSVPPHQTSAPPHQVSVPPHQTSAPPHQISVPPHQTSGPPMPLPEMPGTYPTSGPPSPDPSGYDPLYSPVRHIVPSEPAPSRRRLWILVGAAALVVVLAVGGTVFALSGGEDPVTPSASPTAEALPPMPSPTNPPLQPGLEPPTPGSWPAKWPSFTERDNVRTLSDLEGLGFQLKVPAGWECSLAGRAQGFAKYNCGVPEGAGPKFGGELVVRDCAQPCDEAQQVAMRQAEEAWGQRWIRSGQHSTYVETSSLEENGEPRHGLVVVAFFRGGDDGVVNRQLVLRLTAPRDGALELRRVATYLRNTLIF
ncbi:ribosomal eL19 family protein [Plantactinospora sonchi]|uniref:Uncharacterized protein n=1 Tax=Plantactinospora sonchi TaxID=1544735 RepID=A0ABU7S4Y0_9ACTN